MKISFIVPLYKGNTYIPSILDQVRRNVLCLERNEKNGKSATNGIRETAEVELVLVNDSPWEPVVLPAACREDPEAKAKEGKSCGDSFPFSVQVLTNEKNAGIHQSRINGIRAASGDYLVMLDQDDKISDNYLASQLKSVGDADFCIANGYDEKEDGSRVPIFTSERQLSLCLALDTYIRYDCPVKSPGQALIRKSAMPKRWMQRTLTYNGADDMYLWMLFLADKEIKGVTNPEKIYIHSYTGSNASLDFATMKKSDLEVAENLKGVIPDRKIRYLVRRTEYLIPDDSLAEKEAGGNHQKGLLRKLGRLKYLDIKLTLLWYQHVLYR